MASPTLHALLGSVCTLMVTYLPTNARSCPGPTIISPTMFDSLSIMPHNTKYETDMDW